MFDAATAHGADRFPKFNIKPAMRQMNAAAQVMREWRSAE
jgi:hypothetical protein